jgi:hypothetical protein
MRIEPVVGTRYNFYVVIDETVEMSLDGKRMFHVRCDCGKQEYKRAGHLLKGRTKSCKSCASKRTAENFPPPHCFKGVGGLSKTHFSSIANGAKRRGIVFDVSIEFLWDLYLKQKFKCAITGLEIILKPAIKNCNVNWDEITASLDRKDSSKGYTNDNVWWVHKEVNRLKNNYSMDELVYWCKLILSTHGNPEPSVSNSIKVDTKVQRLEGEELTNNPSTSARPLEY